MTWTLNELRKTGSIIYIPGTPGVPGDPGEPATPGYTYTEESTVGGERIVSALEPEGFDVGYVAGIGEAIYTGGYRYFSGKRANLVSTMSDGAGGYLFVYQFPTSTESTIITVPGDPGRPPTPPIPPTPAQTIITYKLGWNAGAIGGTRLDVGEAVSWQFSRSAVGAVVGVSDVLQPQDQGYRGMGIAVMANSGTFRIIRDGVPITSAQSFSDEDEFSLVVEPGGVVSVVLDGEVLASSVVPMPAYADCSLYSLDDVLWDAQVGTAEILPIYVEGGASQPYGAGIEDKVSVAGLLVDGVVWRDPIIVPGVCAMEGEGTLGAQTLAAAGVSQVLVNGVVQVWTGAVTLSNAEAEAFETLTLGPGTPYGDFGAVTAYEASFPDINAGLARYGAADVAMHALLGAGSESGVYVGWTGDFPGDAVSMAPLEVESINDLIEPRTAIGNCVMVPMTASGYGVTGGVSVAADMALMPMEALGSEGDYAGGDVHLNPLVAFGGDFLEGTGHITGELDGSIMFSLEARGWETAQNRANLRLDNVFAIEAYGGAQGELSLELSLEATGSIEGVGRLSASLPALTIEAHGFVGAIGTLEGSIAFSMSAYGGAQLAGELPRFAIEAEGTVGIVGNLNAVLGPGTFVLEAFGTDEAVGRADLTIPAIQSVYGVLHGQVPMFSLRASGQEVLEALYRAYAVNVKNSALTEYTNFPFNHLVRFRGETVAFADGGAFTLGGDTDNGSQIDSVAELPPTDFGESQLKRLPYVYVGADTDDHIKVTAIADEKEVVSNQTSTVGRTRRAKLPRGVKARFWAVRIENNNGEHFAVDSVEYLPELLRRKV